MPPQRFGREQIALAFGQLHRYDDVVGMTESLV